MKTRLWIGLTLAITAMIASSSRAQRHLEVRAPDDSTVPGWPVNSGPEREFSVEAPALSGIEIDGDLSDWPAAIPRYPVRHLHHGKFIGYGGLEGADLSTSADLSVSFSVGYDPAAQLLYVAVIVRDDELIVGNTSHLDTDACEIYIDGLHGERTMAWPPPEKQPWWEKVHASELPVQQYVAIPGPGRAYGNQNPPGGASNPIIMAGDIRESRSRMAYQRKGDVTIYEWAIQVFDRFPDRPTKLEPGKRIGFDLAVADKDVPANSLMGMEEAEENRPAYCYWGPRLVGMKLFIAGNLGEVVFGPLPPETAEELKTQIEDIEKRRAELKAELARIESELKSLIERTGDGPDRP